MPTLRFTNSPDRNSVASQLGVDPFSLNISQGADGTWSVQVPNDALPDAIVTADVVKFQQDTAAPVVLELEGETT